MYLASDDGQIYSTKPNKNSKDQTPTKPRLMKPHKSKDGYYRIRIDNHTKLVHRLVLSAFCGPCPEGYQSCHNDGNKDNNAISNLRYDTHIKNNHDKILHGTSGKGEKNAMAKLKTEQVYKIKELLLKDGSMNHIKQIANSYNVSHGIIYLIKAGKRWQHLY